MVAALMLAAIIGCGRSPDPIVPLTIEEWKLLPIADKYDAHTLERLKEGSPPLATPEGWEEFRKTILAQAQKSDKRKSSK